MRSNIESLIRDLASSDDAIAEAAVWRAKDFIDETNLHYLIPGQSPASRQEGVSEDQRIVRLTSEELRLVIDGLIKLLDGPLHLASVSAFSLSNSFCLDAVPSIANFLRRTASMHGFEARQAVIAMSDILSGTHINYHDYEHEEEIMKSAQDALLYANTHGINDASNLRDQATSALNIIRNRMQLLRSSRCDCESCRPNPAPPTLNR